MTGRGVRVKLAVFAATSIVATLVLLLKFGGLEQQLVAPYLVRAHFADATGVFPRAEVDLLGTPVGTVREIGLDPGGDMVVTLALDHGTRVPADVSAAIANKSAIGEQYIALTPRTATGPLLTDGGLIPLARTTAPVRVEQLLDHLNGLVGSVPTEALTTSLVELSSGIGGRGADLRTVVDQTHALARTGVDNLHDQIGLIRTARTVLDTQASRGPLIVSSSARLARITGTVHDLVPTLAGALSGGTRASEQFSGLLLDSEKTLPVLLHDLDTVSGVAAPRAPQVRKTLASAPWALQVVLEAIRYCDANDPKTGEPIESTCQYDSKGNPKYTLRTALQLPERPAAGNPYLPCRRGYEGTRNFLPNGTPTSGKGPAERPDEPPNNHATCTAPPTDPGTPNVRGAQNAQSPGR
ncbi:MlaD family protein [Pseudonocardia spinosispora]|uniref:MlaD family protein n=1 Tax=Pseudonocardia spinosispora TaxID=103441 RepID=UPI0003FBAC0E|nr:MlaD family protein [Pseudonocardia spinosispora]